MRKDKKVEVPEEYKRIQKLLLSLHDTLMQARSRDFCDSNGNPRYGYWIPKDENSSHQVTAEELNVPEITSPVEICAEDADQLLSLIRELFETDLFGLYFPIGASTYNSVSHADPDGSITHPKEKPEISTIGMVELIDHFSEVLADLKGCNQKEAAEWIKQRTSKNRNPTSELCECFGLLRANKKVLKLASSISSVSISDSLRSRCSSGPATISTKSLSILRMLRLIKYALNNQTVLQKLEVRLLTI